MEFTSQKISDVTLIKIQGRIDHNTAKDFEKAFKPYLDQCISGQQKKIIVDLNGVDFMTSAGLRVLLKAVKELKRTDGRLCVCAVKDYIREIFSLSGFLTFLPTHSTLEESLLTFHQPS